MNKTIKDIKAQIALITGNDEVKKNLMNEVSILERIEDKYDSERKELHLELYGYVSDKKIKEVFKKDFIACKSNDSISNLYNKYIPYIWFNRTLNTSLKKHSELRKIIKEESNRIKESKEIGKVIKERNAKKSDHALKNVFSLGQKDVDIYKFRQSKTDLRVTAQRENNTVESDFKTKDIKELVTKLKDLVDNFDKRLEEKVIPKASSAKVNIIKAYYLSFLLGLTTGRRQIELLKDFSIVTKRGKVEFHELAKKNYNDDGKEILEGTVNFISVKDAQKYLKMLRKELPTDGMTNEEINKKYNAMFNKAFRDRLVNNPTLNIKSDKKPLFNDSLDANGKRKAPNFHKMRSAYALTVYKMECEKNKGKVIDRIEVMAKALNQVYRKNNAEHYDKAL